MARKWCNEVKEYFLFLMCTHFLTMDDFNCRLHLVVNTWVRASNLNYLLCVKFIRYTIMFVVLRSFDRIVFRRSLTMSSQVVNSWFRRRSISLTLLVRVIINACISVMSATLLVQEAICLKTNSLSTTPSLTTWSWPITCYQTLL